MTMSQPRIRLITRGDDCGSARTFMDPRIVRYCSEKGVLPIRYDEAT